MAKLTQKRAVEISIDVWFWFKENPLKGKDDYELEVGNLSQYRSRCPLCSFFGGCLWRTGLFCPLYPQDSGGCIADCAMGHYSKWVRANGEGDRRGSKRHSTAIYKMLIDYYQERWGKK